MRALLRDEVIKKRKHTLDDPAMAPAIARLTHVANILQAWVRNAPWEEECNDLSTARLRPWSVWVVNGIPPLRHHSGGILGQPRYGRVEPAGLERWGILNAVEDSHVAARAARAHAFELVCGNGDNPYHTWLEAIARAPLITRSIKQCKDYAPDLCKIFRSELRPDPGNEAAFRFISSTARTITGERLSDNAVKKELQNQLTARRTRRKSQRS
jgi:hypothetical protein